MKNKRGQFFLVAAIIIVVIIFGLSTVYTETRTTVEDETPEILSQEISFEGAKLIDYGVFQDKDTQLIQEYLDSLGGSYLENNPNMRIILIYYDSETGDSAATDYSNTNTGSVNILDGGIGEQLYAPASSELIFDIKGNKGKFDLDGVEQEINLVPGKGVAVILVENKGNDRIVSVAE